MRYKYGELTQKQIQDYKKELHSAIHWLLIYKESHYEYLDKYFEKVLLNLAGLNSLMPSTTFISIISLIESARLENQKDVCNFAVYRKTILDAHSLIDLLPETDGDNNG